MMTNGQHDGAWLNVMDNAIPRMSANLNWMRQVEHWKLQLEVLKELYELGELSKEDYVVNLQQVRKNLRD